MSEELRIARIHAQFGECPGDSTMVGETTNVWVVGDDRDVVVVDPAGASNLVADAIEDRQVTAVLCTHGRRAHIASAMTLGEAFHTPVLLHTGDHAAWQAVHGDCRYWRLDDGQRIAFAGTEIHVLHTPTATPGSVSLHIPRYGMAFTGDSLSRQNPSYDDDAAVLGTFASLDSDTLIHPGHGDSYVLRESYLHSV